MALKNTRYCPYKVDFYATDRVHCVTPDTVLFFVEHNQDLSFGMCAQWMLDIAFYGVFLYAQEILEI